MTEDIEYGLSRRKALAALGAIGAASAGAGIGTSAFFSDQETFENNQLVAGTLDMKVSWAEHYSDWSEDEAEFAHGGRRASGRRPAGIHDCHVAGAVPAGWPRPGRESL
jgi:predicted ribosomally synthesized peptide with SipW-like signal peptide